MEEHESPLDRKRRLAKERKRRWLEKQTPEDKQKLKEKERERKRTYRQNETEEQTKLRNALNANTQRLKKMRAKAKLNIKTEEFEKEIREEKPLKRMDFTEPSMNVVPKVEPRKEEPNRPLQGNIK